MLKNRLLHEDLYYSCIQQYEERIYERSAIVIWGCGNNGQLLYDFLTELGFANKVKYFADNNPQVWGSIFNERLVLSPQELIINQKQNIEIYIIIACKFVMEVKKQLLSHGIDDENIDTQGLYLAMNKIATDKETPYKIIYSHLNDYEKVYSYLSDERSRTVFVGILNSKISMDNKYMTGISSPWKKQYFDDEIIVLRENEVFCDCGSYNGDTLDQFVTVTDGKYEKYIAIEADIEIYKELLKKIEKRSIDNIIAYNVACWNEKTILRFQSEQRTGHIAEAGDIAIQADSLDHLISDEKVTFVKMDIEGAEEMALKGAINIIKSNHPVLAICIYHKMEDYYKLPILIKELNEDYRLFIRHYMDMYSYETICYAIPVDRFAR